MFNKLCTWELDYTSVNFVKKVFLKHPNKVIDIIPIDIDKGSFQRIYGQSKSGANPPPGPIHPRGQSTSYHSNWDLKSWCIGSLNVKNHPFSFPDLKLAKTLLFQNGLWPTLMVGIWNSISKIHGIQKLMNGHKFNLRPIAFKCYAWRSLV